MRRCIPAILLAFLLAACSGATTPGRLTYIVKYAVSGTITATDVDYTDETGTTVTALGAAVPWSVESPPLDYDYASPFEPKLRIYNASLLDGQSVTLAVSWKDYKVGFAEELLADRTVSITTGGPAAQDITLFGPPLPP